MGSHIGRVGSDAQWAGATGALALAVIALAAWLEPGFNYNRWDNYELFTPLLTQAHELWLEGTLPVWNPHQHLGEPILGMGQPAPFYPGYTLAVALLRGLDLPAGSLMLVIALLHVPFAAAGFFLLGRALGQLRSISVLLALSATFSGYVTAISTVWMWMLPVFAWLPWILWGLVNVLTRGARGVGAIVLVVGMAIEATLGRPPMWAYLWLFVALFAATFGLWVHRSPRRTAEAFLLLGVAALLSAPPLLPMVAAIGLSDREASYTFAEFVARSVPPEALLGWFHPLLAFQARFLPDATTRLLYQGGWVVPALVGGLVAAITVRRRGREEAPFRAFVAMLTLALLFTAFALGENGVVYGWTHGIPVWSSFRWPFRILLLSQPALAITAALGAGLWIQSAPRSRRVLLGLGAVACLPALGLLAVAPAAGAGSIVGVAGSVTAVASMAVLPWAAGPRARAVLVALSVLTSILLTAICHRPGWKDDLEPWATVGPDVLGITSEARVLPAVSTQLDVHAPRLQHLSLFHAATGNGYDSATGTVGGLLPAFYAEALPARVDGTLRFPDLQRLVGSQLLASFNVGYLLAEPGDDAALALLGASGAKRIRSQPEVIVFQSRDVLPRAYFATHAFPHTDEALVRGMIRNEVPARSAYVLPAWEGPRELPDAEIRAERWEPSEFSFSVDAPEGGLLVVSVSWSPDWRAHVDGRPADVLRVNSRILGVPVPPGGREIVIGYRSDALRLGGVIFAVGGVLFLAYALASRRRRRHGEA